MATLNGVISEFGGSGAIPINMNSYYKLGATLGWNGGVAQHDNNSAIPTTGELRLSNFDSPADKDFVSDNWTQGISTYVDGLSGDTWIVTGISTLAGLAAAGFVYNDATGSAGARVNIGKSTFGASGQLAPVSGVYDWNFNGQPGFIIQMTGDQRRGLVFPVPGSWGGADIGYAPFTVVINSQTRTFDSAFVPDGTYDPTYNITTWSWPGGEVGLSGTGTTTFRVSIY
jgi:hypothetical protein